MNTVSAIAGAILIAVSALYWGFEKCRGQKIQLSTVEGLVSFVTYTGEQIETFRTPLPRIYSEFTHVDLENIGFCETLRHTGLDAALKAIDGKIPDDAMREMQVFALGVGGSYEKGQSSLCAYTTGRLERCAAELKEALPGKIKMYRLLPVLLACSVIILLL